MSSEDPGLHVSRHSLQSPKSWKRLQPWQSLDSLGKEHILIGDLSESHVHQTCGLQITTGWHYQGFSKNYFQYITSIMFTSPEWLLWTNVKQKSKSQCFLSSKTVSSGAELGHLLLSHRLSARWFRL